MRRVFLVVLLLTSASVLGLLGQAQVPRLIVYTYDSFASWGPAPFIEEEFEKEHRVDVQFVATADSRAMLAKLIRERATGEQGADVFIGVEAADLPTIWAHGLFIPLTVEDVPELANLPPGLLIDPQREAIPYEHGYITFVYDSQVLAVEDVPRTFEELLDPQYRKMLILEDPRTSS
ncbi:MAG: extracellular solute-binding protein, partial [Candidatus Bipolaricaulia bacterium]